MTQPNENPRSGKPGPGPGIRPDPQMTALIERIIELEKKVTELTERNHWGKLLQSWVGQHVCITTITSDMMTGRLQWADRYVLCLDADEVVDDPYLQVKRNEGTAGTTGLVIVHKAAIQSIRQSNKQEKTTASTA